MYYICLLEQKAEVIYGIGKGVLKKGNDCILKEIGVQKKICYVKYVFLLNEKKIFHSQKLNLNFGILFHHKQINFYVEIYGLLFFGINISEIK